MEHQRLFSKAKAGAAGGAWLTMQAEDRLKLIKEKCIVGVYS